MRKTFIHADQLLEDSFNLAWKVYESGFRPNYIIGVWRGGAPIGIAVQEFLEGYASVTKSNSPTENTSKAAGKL